MALVAPTIEKEIFVEILQDKSVIQADDLLIFQTLYSLKKQEASATDLARILGWSDKGAVIGRIVGLGKRILKKYEVEQHERNNGSKAFWDFFFTGYQQHSYFIYRLKPELAAALEECGLTTVGNSKVEPTYLFVWNPIEWPWNEMEKDIQELETTGKTTLRWKCRSHQSIRAGDRAFLAGVKLKSQRSGIMGSGIVVSNSFSDKDF